MRILLFFLLWIASTLRGWADDRLTLAQLLTDIRARNPLVQAAQASAAADRERIAQMAAWEDPKAGVESQRQDTLRLDRSSAFEFSVSQTLPLTAARRRRVDLAKAEAAAGDRRTEAELVPLLIEATDAFYRLARARELRALTRRSDEILARAVSAVQSRLAEGGANVASVLLAETERVRLEELVIDLDREEGEAATVLNTLRNLPPQNPVGPLDLSTTASDRRPLISFETLQERALAFRPELRAAEAQITAAERATDLARAWWPDPEVMVRARHMNANRDPISEYDVGIAVSLPWLNGSRYRASIREAQHKREAAELTAASLRARTLADLRDAWTRFEAAAHTVRHHEEQLLPLAERTLEAAQTGLDSGRTGLLELIAAQKNLREMRNDLAGAQINRARAAAVLAAMTGQSVFTFVP
jgi:cobalt-zinc-cadmium efflux system outer membrane protein